jgi:hypothetical protein
MLCVATNMVFTALYVTFRREWVLIFSGELPVVDMTVSVIPIQVCCLCHSHSGVSVIPIRANTVLTALHVRSSLGGGGARRAFSGLHIRTSLSGSPNAKALNETCSSESRTQKSLSFPSRSAARVEDRGLWAEGSKLRTQG